MKKTWLEDVVIALESLGGVASLKEIYDQVIIQRKDFPESYKAIIRRTLEQSSSDSESFNGKEDIFYSVDGIGNGNWGLRIVKDTIFNDLSLNKDSIYIGYDRKKVCITPEELARRLEKSSRIGLLGEVIAKDFEINRLIKKYGDSFDEKSLLISEHFATDVTKGFDIESEYQGEIRYIEVKTSYDAKSDIFFSINEYNFLKKMGDLSWIYRVILNKKDDTVFKIIEVNNPFRDKNIEDLNPISFRCSLDILN